MTNLRANAQKGLLVDSHHSGTGTSSGCSILGGRIVSCLQVVPISVPLCIVYGFMWWIVSAPVGLGVEIVF